MTRPGRETLTDAYHDAGHRLRINDKRVREKGAGMKVSEFIEWLKSQDQDATVEIVSHYRGTGLYDQGGTMKIEQFNPENHADHTRVNGRNYIIIGGYEQ